ncbi:MAG TPA: DCC1-like thiol-disulfide oxidoreductase family protein [Planctomycetota bacterium]|nr:DCC1-like thiol-disulfide oxidoreductase family protein [Planctomycetota bacterium]
MIRAWLKNPWEAAAVVSLALAGIWFPAALAGAGVLFAVLEIIAGLKKENGPRWWPSFWPRADRTVTVLYDGHCVLCLKSKEKLEHWRTAPRMSFLALQSPDARRLVPEMDEKHYQGSMHVVEEGKIYSAHEGWYRLMTLAPLPLGLLAALTPVFVARPMYAWVARNRFRWFGKVCEGGTCPVHSGGKDSGGTR